MPPVWNQTDRKSAQGVYDRRWQAHLSAPWRRKHCLIHSEENMQNFKLMTQMVLKLIDRKTYESAILDIHNLGFRWGWLSKTTYLQLSPTDKKISG
jgi:hypothetical protein